MEQHVKIISILWIISGILGLFMAFMIFGVLFGITFIPDIEYDAVVILRIIAVWGSMFFAVLAAPDIIGGIGLMKKKEWARILVLVLSFFNLLWFPLGTALGVYSIVILIREDTVKLFKKSPG